MERFNCSQISFYSINVCSFTKVEVILLVSSSSLSRIRKYIQRIIYNLKIEEKKKISSDNLVRILKCIYIKKCKFQKGSSFYLKKKKCKFLEK